MYSLTASSAPHDSDTRFRRSTILSTYSTHAERRKGGEWSERGRSLWGRLVAICPSCAGDMHQGVTAAIQEGGFSESPPLLVWLTLSMETTYSLKTRRLPPPRHAHEEHNEREEFFVTLVFYKPFWVGLGKLGTLLVKTNTRSCALLCRFGSSAPCSHYAVL